MLWETPRFSLSWEWMHTLSICACHPLCSRGSLSSHQKCESLNFYFFTKHSISGISATDTIMDEDTLQTAHYVKSSGHADNREKMKSILPDWERTVISTIKRSQITEHGSKRGGQVPRHGRAVVKCQVEGDSAGCSHSGLLPQFLPTLILFFSIITLYSFFYLCESKFRWQFCDWWVETPFFSQTSFLLSCFL